MNVHQMKITALNNAMRSDDDCGLSALVGARDTWKLVCHCSRLTEFTFYIENNEIKRPTASRACRSVTEAEVTAFILGVGYE
jgi:hypothetical protein